MITELFHNKRDAGKSRSMLIGLAASLLIHGLALWAVLHREELDMQPVGDQTGNRIAVSILPPAPIAPPAPPSQAKPPTLAQATPPTPKKKAAPAPGTTKQSRKPAPDDSKTAATRPTPPLASAERSMPPPEQDFSTALEAARQRRQQASGLSAPEPAETEPSKEAAPNDNSVAMANIEFSLNRAKGKDNVGGLFQVRRIGYRDAEFVFYGWSERSRRNSTRLITVEQGSYADIQTAMIKKVIAIIREEKTGDFVWQSTYLGKPITLSAKPQDNKELEQFLMREFFPGHMPAAPLG
ncbi:MAG: hypothetical protein ACO1NO_05740 [Burkholderiaceae bacterium]